MINYEIIESFWERVSFADANDRFILSTIEAKQLISLCRSDIYNKIDCDFEPVRNKAEKLYNDYASLINDALMKARENKPYTYKAFFERYNKLNSTMMGLYIESDISNQFIEELGDCISILNESFS